MWEEPEDFQTFIAAVLAGECGGLEEDSEPAGSDEDSHAEQRRQWIHSLEGIYEQDWGGHDAPEPEAEDDESDEEGIIHAFLEAFASPTPGDEREEPE